MWLDDAASINYKCLRHIDYSVIEFYGTFAVSWAAARKYGSQAQDTEQLLVLRCCFWAAARKYGSQAQDAEQLLVLRLYI